MNQICFYQCPPCNQWFSFSKTSVEVEPNHAWTAWLALGSGACIQIPDDRPSLIVQDSQTKLLPLIAAFKILKALSLFALALGLHHLRVGNAESIILAWCKDIRIDPDNRIAHSIISKITGLPASRLHALGIGTFFYGAMFATEGTGLLLKQKWAEYLTIVSTVTFLPLEIYELVARPHRKALKAILLVINLAIVVYLLMNLRKSGKTRSS